LTPEETEGINHSKGRLALARKSIYRKVKWWTP
jgi:hypothetical protein